MWKSLVESLGKECRFEPQANNSEITEAEAKLNVAFPDALRSCLLESNGVFGEYDLGLVAQQVGWQRHFQANTIRERAVLSVVRLGKEVRRRTEYIITEQRIRWAINEFRWLSHSAGLKDL